MINIKNLSHCFGPRLLFQGVDLNILKNRRYGLVGANGTGKTTFLKLLCGFEEYDDGEITIPKNCRIGYQGQDQFLEQDDLIHDIVMRGDDKLWKIHQERLAFMADDFEWTEDATHRYAEVEEEFANRDGYQAEGNIEKILLGLGIEKEYHDQPLSLLSGGFRLRVYLARALFNEPDCLLLDEPTNHLDIYSIRWLEEYLQSSFTGALIFISHDTSFVNRVSTDILDVDYGNIREYRGNYEKFLILKKEYELQKERELTEKTKEREHLQKFIDKFKAKASKAKQAKSKQKMLDRIELPDLDKSSRRYMALKFVIPKNSGKNVLTVEKISKAFDENLLYRNVSFEVHKGDKLAIIGQNGIGKSTLLKILMDELKADGGSFHFAENVTYGYLPQNPDDYVDPDKTILDWMRDEHRGTSDQVIRRLLGAVFFSGDDVEKKIDVLSGGEKIRLMLAHIMVQEPNLLVLDEPTNHLDIESIESLKRALKVYEGSLIVVSHNENFLRAVTNKTLLLKNKKYDYIPGGYDPKYLEE